MAGWAAYAEKYAIHQETYDYYNKHIELGSRPYTELALKDAREQSLHAGTVMSGEVDFEGETSDIIVPSPHDPDGIRVQVYKPHACNGGDNAPAILVFFHGGGLVLGDPRVTEPALKIIAGASGVIVVNSSYRLLPNKTSAVAPFEDGRVVMEWVVNNKTAVGGKPESKVGVGGDSSGGQIASLAAISTPGLHFQILVYPITDLSFAHDSFKEFQNVPGQSQDIVTWYYENTFAHMDDPANDPKINPSLRPDMEKTPPTLMIFAELDPLIGPGLSYADKIKDAGVPVRCEIIRGVPHAFFCYREVFKTKAPEAYAHVIEFLNQFTNV